MSRITIFIPNLLFALTTLLLLSISSNLKGDTACLGSGCRFDGKMTTCDGGGCQLTCIGKDRFCSCKGGRCIMNCIDGARCICKGGECIMSCVGGASCEDGVAATSHLSCIGKGTSCCGGRTTSCSKKARCTKKCAKTASDISSAQASRVKSPRHILKPSKSVQVSLSTLRPIDCCSHHSSTAMTPFLFGGQKRFDAVWPYRDELRFSTVDGESKEVTHLRSLENERLLSAEYDLVKLANGCFFVVWLQERDVQKDQLWGMRFCPQKPASMNEIPVLIAQTDEGAFSAPRIWVDKAMLIAAWQHTFPSGSRRSFITRVRAKDNKILDPGGRYVLVNTANAAAKMHKGRVLFAWRKRSDTGGKMINRVQWADYSKQEWRFNPPITLPESASSSGLNNGRPSEEETKQRGRIVVSGDDENFLVVWDGGARLLARRFRLSDGFCIDHALIRLDKASSTGMRDGIARISATFDPIGQVHRVFWATSDTAVKETSSSPTALKSAWIKTNQKRINIKERHDFGTHLRPIVAVNDRQVLVASQKPSQKKERYTIEGIRYSASSGNPLDTVPIPISTTYSFQTNATAAYGDGMFLVVWQDDQREGVSGQDLFAVRIRAKDMKVLDDSAITVSNAAENQIHPQVSFSDGVFLIVWEDNRSRSARSADVYGARLRASTGNLLDKSGIPIARTPRNETTPQIHCGAGSCMVSWQIPNDSGSHLPWHLIANLKLKSANTSVEREIRLPDGWNSFGVLGYRNHRWQAQWIGGGWNTADLDPQTLRFKNRTSDNPPLVDLDDVSPITPIILPAESQFDIALFHDRGAILGGYKQGKPILKELKMPSWLDRSGLIYNPYPAEKHPMFSLSPDAVGGRAIFGVVRNSMLRLMDYDTIEGEVVGYVDLPIPIVKNEDGSPSRPALAIDNKGQVLLVHHGIQKQGNGLAPGLQATIFTTQ
jgi:hypothetical protein